MKLTLTDEQLHAIKDCVKFQIEGNGEHLKEHEAYSHGDWLRADAENKRLKEVYKKLRRLK